MKHTLQALAGVLTLTLMAACHQQSSEESSFESDSKDQASQDTGDAAPARPHHRAPKICADCGTIDSIEKMRQAGEGSGAGAVLGAIVGGVIGHQFGKGRGQDVATAAGAVGGAVAGHETEKQVRADTFYRVTVKMDDGQQRTIDVKDPAGLAIGGKVKVNGNIIEPQAG